MTLLFISHNSTSFDPLSSPLSLDHWPMQFSYSFRFSIFALKSPAIMVLDVDIVDYCQINIYHSEFFVTPP